MIERSNIIVLIRNVFFPQDYLVYYDKGWDTWFFPNFTNKGQTEEELKREIAKRFWTSTDLINLSYVSSFSETKQCAEHENEERSYDYVIYEARFNRGLERFNCFSLAGLNYHWKSIEDLMKIDSCVKTNKKLINAVSEAMKNRVLIKKEIF